MSSSVLPLPVVNSSSKIQLTRLSHVYHRHPDLHKFQEFAHDFGFEEVAEVDGKIYYRGYGKDPYIYVASKSCSEKEFGGGAFIAKTQQDFEKAAEFENSVVSDLSKAPGGGKMVSIPIPSGNNFHIVFGQEEREAAKTVVSKTEVHKGAFNTSLEKLRKGTAGILGRIPKRLLTEAL
jgi:hypothetical protein